MFGHNFYDFLAKDSASSLKQQIHFFQLSKSGRFQQFDYYDKNMEIYNQSKPPDYDLKLVLAPIYIYAGRLDALVAEKDVEHLRDVLPNVKKYQVLPTYDHTDFIFGKTSRSDVYEGMMKAMNSEKCEDK
jgi:lysosomal acid lipase/cholesteryl ester hydrolase